MDIATRFGIVTPYTAYLAEEPEMALPRRRAIDAVTSVDELAAAAPAAGKEAVGRADEASSGCARARLDRRAAAGSRVVGAHTFYLVDGTWMRDDYEPGTEAPEVVVGSAEFPALLADAPESPRRLRSASASSPRVPTAGSPSSGRRSTSPTPPTRLTSPSSPSPARTTAGTHERAPAVSSCAQYGSGMKVCSSMGGRT